MIIVPLFKSLSGCPDHLAPHKDSIQDVVIVPVDCHLKRR
jgi:hypothetical protein